MEDPEYNSYHILSDCVQRNQWQHVCDFKCKFLITSVEANCGEILTTLLAISDSMTVYKYSEKKAVSWLRSKVETQVSSLEEHHVYVGTGSQSAMLVRSNKRSDIGRSMSFCINLLFQIGFCTKT